MTRQLIGITILFLIVSLITANPSDAQKNALEKYTFEREINLAPGEFYAVSYDNNLKGFVEFEPDRKYGCLPDRAIRQILRVPLWLRENFADRLVDLYSDDIDVGDNAIPYFMDVNSDGERDLLISNSVGELKCFLAPYFKEDKNYKNLKVDYFQNPSNIAEGKGFTIQGSDDGSVKVVGESSCEKQLAENLERIKVSGKAYPLFEDVTGDNLPDLLIGASDGTISVYKNYGDGNNWWFMSYSPTTDRRFNFDVGYLSSPRIADINNDGINDIISGGKNLDNLKVFTGPDFKESDCIRYFLKMDFSNTGVIVPACADFNNDGIQDHANGYSDGFIDVFIARKDGISEINSEFSQGLKVSGFASPYAADYDNDGIVDLAVGDKEGKIQFFKGTGSGFKQIDNFFGELKVGEYPSPSAYDFNKDSKTDLVVCNKAGEMKVFLAPEWKEVEGGLGITNVGSFATCTFGDLTGDKIPELLIGNLDGTFRYLEGSSNKWIEKYSWQFHPTIGIAKIEDYFLRTHPECELMRGAIDDASLNSYLDVLESSGDQYIDEIAFAMGNMDTEILRVMSRLENADLVFENAKAIYEFASKVKYAKIVEKEDYSTVEYVMPDGSMRELPRDMYYWWVVHPVIEYDFPARIDASYWRHDNKYYGISAEEWNRKTISVDEYEHTPNAVFWRTFFPKDNRYGKNLVDVVADADDIWEAVTLIADWGAYSSPRPGTWNEYGMQSDDLQPVVIYEKNYGSCGEQAMLCAAFSRTGLIPNAPVGCYGEDHAWNEFWIDGNWYQWDIGSPPFGMKHPWYEGQGHTGTPRLTISRRWGNGRTDTSTTLPINPPGSNFNPGNAPGYSAVGKVRMRVVDGCGEPIEGALIIMRSKWNKSYRQSIWDYTDPEGICDFELGNPDTGSCIADIVTPLGVTGTEYFIVRENESFEYTYTLPGHFNKRKPITGGGLGDNSGTGNLDIKVSVIGEEQRPRNFSGGRRGRFQDDRLREKTGYYGTRWYSEPNDRHYGVYTSVMKKTDFDKLLACREFDNTSWSKKSSASYNFTPASDNVYVFYNSNRFTYVRFKAAITASCDASDPQVKLLIAPSSAIAGDKIIFKGTADDNLHVESLKLSIDGGNKFSDITSAYDRESKEFEYAWDTGAGGPLPAGDYTIVFRVEDGSGNFARTAPIDFELMKTREFKRQVIYQDDPNTPLPVSSWILGPFTVNDGERFLGIESFSVDPDFDMDMYLFYDKNGNRNLDGTNEQILNSSGATAIETIIDNNPQKGAYWIYCQGWHVVDRQDIDPWSQFRNLTPSELLTILVSDVQKQAKFAYLDMSLSFDYNPAFITDINPSQELNPANPIITGKITSPLYARLPAFSSETTNPPADNEQSSVPSACTVSLFEEQSITNDQQLDTSGNSQASDSESIIPPISDLQTISAFMDDKDISDLVRISGDKFTIDLASNNLKTGENHKLRIQAFLKNGLKDSVEINLTVKEPEKVKITNAISDDNRLMTVKLEAIDSSDAIEKSRVRIDELSWIKLKPSDDSRSATCEIPLWKLETGDHKLLIEYQVSGADPASKEIAFKYDKKRGQKQFIIIQPGDGSDVFDHQSMLVVYYAPEIKDIVDDVRVYLDDRDITSEVMKTTDGVIYLPQATYSKGEHTFTVEVTLKDGRKLESSSTFKIKSMDDVEESK